MTKIGMHQSEADHALWYFVANSGATWCLLMSATDNCIYVGDSRGTITKVKNRMKKHIELLELGNIHWFLEVAATCNMETHTISLSQA